MRIIATNQGFECDTIDECFGRMRNEFALDGAELSLYQEWQRPHLRREDIDQVLPAKAKYGFFLAGHIWEDFGRLEVEESAARILAWLDVCRKTGIESMIAHGGTSASRREGLEKLRQILARVLPEFEEAGVVLNLENVPDYDDGNGRRCLLVRAWEFLEVFPRFDSPFLRFCLDTGHANMEGGAESLVKELAPWLNHIHLHDNDGKVDQHLGYRQGTFDWDGLFALLREVGFDGTFSGEFAPESDPGALRRCVADIRRLWP